MIPQAHAIVAETDDEVVRLAAKATAARHDFVMLHLTDLLRNAGGKSAEGTGRAGEGDGERQGGKQGEAAERYERKDLGDVGESEAAPGKCVAASSVLGSLNARVEQLRQQCPANTLFIVATGQTSVLEAKRLQVSLSSHILCLIRYCFF